MPEPHDADVPFSLACEECDGGMEIGSYEEALAAGWIEISYEPEQLTANFLGLCPDCRRRQEEEEEEQARRQGTGHSPTD